MERADEIGEDGDNNEEGDDDLLQLATLDRSEHRWKSYRKWLKLILTHFDAVETIAKYLTSRHFHYHTVAIKILVSATVGTSMLPLNALLKDPNVFPTKLKLSTDTANLPTNHDILQFLVDAISCHPDDALVTINHLLTIIHIISQNSEDMEVTSLGAEQVVALARELANYNLPCWADYTAKLVDDFDTLAILKPSDPISNDHLQDLITDIKETLHLLQDSALVYQSIMKAEFSGSQHCEVTIASVVSLPDGPLKDYFKVNCAPFSLITAKYSSV